MQHHADRVNGRPTDSPPVTATGVRLSPRVVTLRHDRNVGVGGAKKTGYRRAIEDGVDLVASLDGDGQMPPEELHRLLDPIVADQADYAKGNRLWNRTARRGMSRWRLFGNSVLSLLTRASSGYWGMADPQNGYTATSPAALCTIPPDRLTAQYRFLHVTARAATGDPFTSTVAESVERPLSESLGPHHYAPIIVTNARISGWNRPHLQSFSRACHPEHVLR
jgi:hypothetical protein